jgi:hypothetical protein
VPWGSSRRTSKSSRRISPTMQVRLLLACRERKERLEVAESAHMSFFLNGYSYLSSLKLSIYLQTLQNIHLHFILMIYLSTGRPSITLVHSSILSST